MKVGLVHERFTELGGSERVVEQWAQEFPDAPIFAPLVNVSTLPEGIDPARMRTSPLQRLYRGGGYAQFLPLLPWAMRRADLGSPDVVIVSHHAFAHRALPITGAATVSYVHSPARWMWDPNMRAGEVGGRMGEQLLSVFAATQRRADRRAAGRPTRILGNSSVVVDRIERWWGREASVVHPPVRTHLYTPDPAAEREDFFLLAGRLVPYKRPEVAVEAANKAGVRLKVVGAGRALEACEQLAGPGVELLGKVDDAELLSLMRRARALVFPGEEDFGIVPVEAMACGTPVIGLGVGGLLDTVVEGKTGTLVHPSGNTRAEHVAAFAHAFTAFNDSAYDSTAIRTHAEGFGEERFRRQMREHAEQAFS